MTRLARLTVAVLAASTVPLLAGAVPAPTAQAADAPTVSVETGTLRGASHDGVDRFLGVPYAAPPVGDLRWRPPAAADSWSGVREATSYGGRCAALESSNGAESLSEDCLYLNVERPTGATSSSRLPVHVFIHGGGLLNGSSNQAGGEKIPRETNVISVAMNYRLGVFGFLGLPGLSAEGEGNYGFLDQQAALAWVQRNITAFGGDPSRVTVGGESAGGFSVCGHLVADSSRGLFARAMIQSGGCPSRPVAATERDSATVATRARCASTDPDGVVACLRAADVPRLLAAADLFEPTLTTGVEPFPRPLQRAVRRGDFTRVPMVIGSNRDEGRTFLTGLIGADRQTYEQFVIGLFRGKGRAVLTRYPWPSKADRFTAAYLGGAVVTDSGVFSGIGGCGTRALVSDFARWTTVWAYEFDARRGPGLTPIPGYVWGAGHAAELAYLFPTFDNGTPITPRFDAGERQLARDMVQWWGAFAFLGRPAARGLPAWPQSGDARRWLSLRPAGQSTVISGEEYDAEHQCAFWDSL